MPETTAQHRTPPHYRGGAATGAPRLAGLPGVHRAEQLPVEVHETERYDTDDLRLALAGITLSRHHADGAVQWQLDLPDGEDRERLRIPAGTAQPPEEIDALVRGAARDRTVRPVGHARTTRTVIRLRDQRDRLLAEVVHDAVSVATLGSCTEVRSWTEAAVLPLDAPAELLSELATRLADDGLRPAAPATAAELDRLLHPAPPHRRTGPKGTAGAELMRYLATHVDRLAAADLSVRRDEPDAVHRMRVAARRLRSALRAYRPLLDRECTDPIVDGLRTLGRELAPARDAEVLRERIATGLADLPAQLRLGPAEAMATRHFARTEAEARAAVLTELDGDRYAQLRTALDALLEDPPLTGRAARPARRELPAVAARSARRLERAMARATDPGTPAADRDAAVHAARKAGKRLRYATEVARPAVGRPAKRFAAGLKGFQSALGEHQDTVVAREALRELGAATTGAGENGFSFGVLLGRDLARAAEIERELPALWSSAWRRKRRRWLR
ncbi:CYTH and CHAD domain-containing protein [Pseudonocardia sp.]|uniref:CYTH and CHAD domain-containing protein n=1 Tax=Pseudonocardia sp. TaxID=60912 RepID=UPI002628020E|nr:CYTH and CHAD domain-containing protein [Pseudonocardia sp.]